MAGRVSDGVVVLVRVYMNDLGGRRYQFRHKGREWGVDGVSGWLNDLGHGTSSERVDSLLVASVSGTRIRTPY